jgi:hypothetical protein
MRGELPGPLLDYWKGAVVRNLCKIPNFYRTPKSPAERPQMALLEHVSTGVFINHWKLELKTHARRTLRPAPLIQVTQLIRTN